MFDIFGVSIDYFVDFNIPLVKFKDWIKFFNALPFKIEHQEGTEYALKVLKDKICIKAVQGALEVKIDKDVNKQYFDCYLEGPGKGISMIFFIEQGEIAEEPRIKYLEFILEN